MKHRTESAGDPGDQELEASVDGLMDDLVADLKSLAAIPSIAFPGCPEAPVREAYDALEALVREVGLGDEERVPGSTVGELALPDTAPVLTAHIPPPPGDPTAPTVLLYGHYDVQPPGEETLWRSPPFEPTETEDGLGLRARGIADCKANLVVHLGALRAFHGRPPTGVRIAFEGQEEYGSAFDDYPPTDPGRFACDAMVIADTGNIRPGTPTLVTALRGVAELTVEVRTLKDAVHSGEYGGAAPDALLALLAALATLHDARGDVAVEGLRREPWEGTAYTDEEFRALAGVEDGMPLVGTGGLGERLWSGPALTVIGIDAPGVDQGSSAVVPYARAKLNLRLHPRQDPDDGMRALVRHLEQQRPFGIPLTVTPGQTGPGFEAATGGPAYRAAAGALRTAWGSEPVHAATGGSIPLVNGLAQAVPGAEILLFGAEDNMSGLHGPNERVLYSELRAAVLAEAVFLRDYAAAFRGGPAS
ncbi:M20/M25/M40 family metallo-hydrolase [Streptomyces iconiensis]|uniref:M20/M25/M40 family metallo-hydrolase n=1 Tax=Streptomyces iconiensis TaxID=1384038 RepID=A0ABT6ZUX5_9ACTN|nr:M20/M25/M40 family metallo-hydrolase [Streptomyces iconiensis]MDJ1132854.1 M20/M25/M40 family metallo-hydrolase [Streptomyces iconiensis]